MFTVLLTDIVHYTISLLPHKINSDGYQLSGNIIVPLSKENKHHIENYFNDECELCVVCYVDIALLSNTVFAMNIYFSMWGRNIEYKSIFSLMKCTLNHM